jgi:hypothetical protein
VVCSVFYFGASLGHLWGIWGIYANFLGHFRKIVINGGIFNRLVCRLKAVTKIKYRLLRQPDQRPTNKTGKKASG